MNVKVLAMFVALIGMAVVCSADINQQASLLTSVLKKVVALAMQKDRHDREQQQKSLNEMSLMALLNRLRVISGSEDKISSTPDVKDTVSEVTNKPDNTLSTTAIAAGAKGEATTVAAGKATIADGAAVGAADATTIAAEEKADTAGAASTQAAKGVEGGTDDVTDGVTVGGAAGGAATGDVTDGAAARTTEAITVS